MANSKEIRTKIKSVENTRKITKAMEMVAASKMRKAQERMRAARPYAEKIRNVAGHLSRANPEYKHAFMVKRDVVKNVGLIVVSSDKGLCGGLNTNMLRLSFNQMKAWESSGQGVAVSAIGNKGFGFMTRVGGNVKSHLVGLGDKPHMESLIGPVKVMLDAYVAGEIDQLYISFTRFINTMKQEPVLEQLLPLAADQLSDGQAESAHGHWDYIYEPDAKLVLDDLMTRYIESLIYHAVAENMASEQSARMVAMKSASDNAKNVIGELKLVYNKARQAAITKEISEIVGGAAAVS
jgi:F-type H+-transporting ATPase subunit gamma